MALLPNGEITSKPLKTWPLFRLAFRPLFWLGALFGAFSIGIWGLNFTGHLNFSPYGGGYFWHIHEMLFGFTAAIMAGFLLTAVQTWTGVPSIKGAPLAALVTLWLLARIVLFFPSLIGHQWITLIDILFLPLAALSLAIPIIKARKWRNLFFVPIFLLMAGINYCMHLSVQSPEQFSAFSFLTLSHIMVLLISLVMCLMGGRVFPMFTANGTRTARVESIAWLEKLSIASIGACIIITADLFSIPEKISALIFIVAAVSNFIRALRWRIWVTFTTPLVWTLHLSYWAICIGLLMLGLEKLNLSITTSQGYHAITVGGIGLMILAMISRVSLGHTGRLIHVGKIMLLAFMMMALTFIIRILAPVFPSHYLHLILVSAIFWVLAYGLFLVIYLPILFTARADGGDG